MHHNLTFFIFSFVLQRIVCGKRTLTRPLLDQQMRPRQPLPTQTIHLPDLLHLKTEMHSMPRNLPKEAVGTKIRSFGNITHFPNTVHVSFKFFLHKVCEVMYMYKNRVLFFYSVKLDGVRVGRECGGD